MSSAEVGRARKGEEEQEGAMDAFLKALSFMETPESRKIGLSFQPQPDDIFVVTYPKCGTTWLQQIVHGLRSGGDIDFEEISAVVPYIEMAYDCGCTDLSKPQGFLPRAYKTHTMYQDCPKGAGKYIFAIRNPHDVAISFYNFLAGWFFPRDAITVDMFVEEFFCQRGESGKCVDYASYWNALTSWYSHLSDENVLWLHYEDLIQDLPGCVDLISNFLGIGVNDVNLKSIVTHQATFDFMKTHESKFDDHLVKYYRNEACGLDKGAGKLNPKVKNGPGASRVKLSASSKKLLDEKWESIVLPYTGYESYENLRAGVNRSLGRVFPIFG